MKAKSGQTILPLETVSWCLCQLLCPTQEGGPRNLSVQTPLAPRRALLTGGQPGLFPLHLLGPPATLGPWQSPGASPADAPVQASESLSSANGGSSTEATLEMLIFLTVCAEDEADTITSKSPTKLMNIRHNSFTPSCLRALCFV